jgi:hypothetical protein
MGDATHTHDNNRERNHAMKNPYLLSPEFRARHAAIREAGRRRKAEFEAALRVAQAASAPPLLTMSPDDFVRMLDADGPFSPGGPFSND